MKGSWWWQIDKMLADKASDQQTRVLMDRIILTTQAIKKERQEVNGGRGGETGTGWEGGREAQSERKRLASVLRCMSNNQDVNELKPSENKTI